MIVILGDNVNLSSGPRVTYAKQRCKRSETKQVLARLLKRFPQTEMCYLRDGKELKMCMAKYALKTIKEVL